MIPSTRWLSAEYLLNSTVGSGGILEFSSFHSGSLARMASLFSVLLASFVIARVNELVLSSLDVATGSCCDRSGSPSFDDGELFFDSAEHVSFKTHHLHLQSRAPPRCFCSSVT